MSLKWPKIGNEKAVSFLEAAISNNKVASTYIFTGPEDLGKSTIAFSFAKNLQGDNEGSFNSDLHVLQREEDKKSISIEAVRAFIKMMNMSSFSGSYKVGIIKEADYLSEEAKSALLKTLEEPEDMVVIILLVRDLNSLPSTIASRSQILHFQPVSSETVYDYLLENYKPNRSLARDLANLCLGRPLLAIRFLEHPEKYESYLKKTSLWLDIIAEKSQASRLQILDDLFKDRTWSKEALESTSLIFDIAESLARDFLLISLGQRDIVQNSALMGRLEKMAIDLGQGDNLAMLMLRHLKLIDQARTYLAANVNPRLTLEQIVINY